MQYNFAMPGVTSEGAGSFEIVAPARGQLPTAPFLLCQIVQVLKVVSWGVCAAGCSDVHYASIFDQHTAGTVALFYIFTLPLYLRAPQAAAM